MVGGFFALTRYNVGPLGSDSSFTSHLASTLQSICDQTFSSWSQIIFWYSAAASVCYTVD